MNTPSSESLVPLAESGVAAPGLLRNAKPRSSALDSARPADPLSKDRGGILKVGRLPSPARARGRWVAALRAETEPPDSA